MTKITDPSIIRRRERELLDAITDSLDRNALVDVLKTQHRLHTISGIESRQEDLVAIGDSVAYRLDFDVRTVLSVLFDRSGNYVEIPSLHPTPSAAETPAGEPSVPPEKQVAVGKPAATDTPEQPDAESGEYLTLDQIITTKSEMITDSQPTPHRETRPQPRPGERMTRMASDLADMISDINGKKGR